MGQGKLFESWFGRRRPVTDAHARIARARRRARVTARVVDDSAAAPPYLAVVFEPWPGESVRLPLAYDFTPEQRVRLLDTGRLELTYDPDEPANFRTAIEEDFADELAAQARRANVSATPLVLDAPLWAHGHDRALAWLLPDRAAGPEIVIAGFENFWRAPDASDEGEHDTDQEMFVWAAAHRAAEHLALTTTARARSSMRADRASDTVDGDAAPGSLPDAQIVSGYVPDRYDMAELSVRVRGPGALPRSTTLRTFTLPGALADWLAGAGLVAPRPAPAWYRAQSAAAATATAKLVVGLVRQLASGADHAALPPFPASSHAAVAELALDYATADDDGLLHLHALAVVHHAARAGALAPADRARAVALLHQYAGSDHPIALLAPSFLVGLGRRDEARAGGARERTAFRDSASAYDAWLARVLS